MTRCFGKSGIAVFMGCALGLTAAQASAQLSSGQLCHANNFPADEALLKRTDKGITSTSSSDLAVICGVNYPSFNNVDPTFAYIAYHDASPTHLFFCNARATVGNTTHVSPSFATCDDQPFGCSNIVQDIGFTGFGFIAIPNPINGGTPINGVISMSILCQVPSNSTVSSYGMTF